METKIVHPQEICRVLGISRSTCKRWIDAGIIPGHRTPGGHRRVMEHEFVAAMKRLGIPMVAPLGNEPATSAPLTPDAIVGNNGILAIDNNQGFLVTLELAINTALPQVPFHSATNGFVAGALVERLHPKVVILDLQMPGLDGVEVCRWLREMPGGDRLHIITITAHAGDPLRCAAFISAGGERVFPKPLNEPELIAWLRAALATP